MERRLLLTVPAVVSLDRSTPAAPDTSAASVTFAVTFSESVSNVDATDFRVTTSGTVQNSDPVVVAGSGASYTVTVNGIHGSGTLRLDLIDDDSITNGTSTPLGDTGLYNGSFQGQTYTIDQTAPFVASITRNSPATLPVGVTSAVYTVTFSEPVTGVDPTDFTFTLSGTVMVNMPVGVIGGPSVYTVTVSGISGSGTLALDLTDNGSVKDLDGNRLVSATGLLSLTAQPSPATGTAPISVAGGDVNGDGKPDLVVANFLGHNVSVLLGNGNGTVQTQTTFLAGVDPNTAIAADVNGDARLDIVVPNYFDANVSVLLGNGDGTFQSQVTYGTLLNPVSAAVVDVSGDGKPDLIVANRGSNSVSVLLGNGNGTFQAQTAYAVGTMPQSVAVSDVNGDGKPDLLVANSGGNNVSVLLGNGNGTFQPQTTYAVGLNPQFVAAADVNGDGLRDLVVANSGGNSLSVLLGNGAGSFPSQTVLPVGSQPQSVVVADMNADGKPDLVVANSLSNNLGVLLGNGDGTFQDQNTSAAGSSPYALAALDLDTDGRMDVVAVNLFGANATVLLGSSSGTAMGQIYTVPPAAVVGRRLFYWGSTAFDVTTEALPGFSDDNAVAPDKSAYLPGAGLAVFANVSSYSRGINGIMIDLLGPGTHASISVSDFVFKVGNNNMPGSWAAAPAPSAVWIRPGQGTNGSDRVEITWPNAAIKNTWLEVEVLANANTGLLSPDVFYWGNKIGDTGTSPPPTMFETTSTDASQVLSSYANGVAITNTRDFNRSGNVDSTDSAIVLGNLGNITRLNLGAPPMSTVVGRHIFYNQSSFDGGSAAIDFVSDELARAPDKSAYLPGAGTAVYANITSYSRGINGIMVDLSGTGAHSSITAADFVFKVGNDNTPASWAAAPAPMSVAVSIGGGASGSDRIEITWSNGAIADQWLEVQVLANANTGLAVTDIFFWGNKVGDSGTSSPSDKFETTTTDAAQVFATLTATGGAAITNLRDFNRSGEVSTTDAAIVFAKLGNIQRINISGPGPFAPGGSGGAGTAIDLGDAESAGDSSIVAAATIVADANTADDTESAGDAGIASALAATSVPSGSTVPAGQPWRGDRPASRVDLNSYRIAAFFRQLADEESPPSGTACLLTDSVLDEIELDDELLDALLTADRWEPDRGA